VLCCCFLLLAGPAIAGDLPARPEPDPKSAASDPTSNSVPFSVEMHMTTNGEEMVMKRTVDGPKTRRDMTAKGMNQTMIWLGSGPVGSMVGQFVGSKLGQKIGSTVGEKAASAVVH
jgi:hypothetical protein